MSKWEANDLERRTAARMSSCGFVPVTNVKHYATQSEFDIYAYHAKPDSVHRTMVQCTTEASPDADKTLAVKGYAATYGLDDQLLVLTCKPHEQKVGLTAEHGIHLLSDHQHSTSKSAEIDGCTIDVSLPHTDREQLIVSFMMGMAHLRRKVTAIKNSQNWRAPIAQKVEDVWRAIEEAPLDKEPPERKPFVRLGKLYKIYFDDPELARNCAHDEKLAKTPYEALWNAMVLGHGEVAQAALAVQTLNRLHTIIAFCECACLAAGGAEVPDDFEYGGKIKQLIEWLMKKDSRHLLGRFAFELLHGWGGMWIDAYHDLFLDRLCEDIRASEEDVAEMIGFVDSVFTGFIMECHPEAGDFHTVLLLPYFAKGIGVRRFRAEFGESLSSFPWSSWSSRSLSYQNQCKQWEEKN